MNKMERLHKLLKHADLFASLNEKSLRLMEKKMKLVSFKPGQVICKEGGEGHVMYLVDTGKVRVLKKNKAGKEVEITILNPGEVAGIMSLFEKDVRSATLKAVGSAGIWELDKEVFWHLLEENHAFNQSMLKVLSKYLRREGRIVAELRSFDDEKRLKVAVFDTKPYTERIFNRQNKDRYALKFYEPRLNTDTVSLASGFKVVCVFVNDNVNAAVVKQLSRLGVELVALRCAGYNNVDVKACAAHGISVTRVPAYSPYAVAEHTVALMMALNRRIFKAHSRVRESNFSLNGLVGFDMHDKTVGVIGTGKIGKCLVNILRGFGCRVLAFDKFPDKALASTGQVKYVKLNDLFKKSDIISLHAPLTRESHHLIDREAINKMKKGVMIINTSRGGLIDTRALIKGLLNGRIGYAGLDVYEEESKYFFEDFSDSVIHDEVLARLTTFNNVLITSHMAFLTKEALVNIADTTYDNIGEYESGKRGGELANDVIK